MYKIRRVLEGLFLTVPERAELLVCLTGRWWILRAAQQLKGCQSSFKDAALQTAEGFSGSHGTGRVFVLRLCSDFCAPSVFTVFFLSVFSRNMPLQVSHIYSGSYSVLVP